MLAVLGGLAVFSVAFTLVAGAVSTKTGPFAPPTMSRQQLVSQCRGLFNSEASDSGKSWAGFGWGPVDSQSAVPAFVLRSTEGAWYVVLSSGPKEIGYYCTSGGGLLGVPMPLLKSGQRFSLSTLYQGPHEPEAGFVVISRTPASVRTVAVVLSDGQTIKSRAVDGYTIVQFGVPFRSGEPPNGSFGELVGFNAVGNVVATAAVRMT